MLLFCFWKNLWYIDDTKYLIPILKMITFSFNILQVLDLLYTITFLSTEQNSSFHAVCNCHSQNYILKNNGFLLHCLSIICFTSGLQWPITHINTTGLNVYIYILTILRSHVYYSSSCCLCMHLYVHITTLQKTANWRVMTNIRLVTYLTLTAKKANMAISPCFFLAKYHHPQALYPRKL